MDTIFQTIKTFIIDHKQHEVVEYVFFGLFILGLIAAAIISIVWLIRINKDIKQMNIDERKRGKRILKFLSRRNNKTY